MVKRPASAIVLLLLLTLGLTGVMAWQAQSAARRHRAAAEGTLRDYAGFAAFLYRQAARSSLYRTLGNRLFVFEQVRPPADGAQLPSAAAIVAGPQPEACPTCPPLDSVRGYFRVDLRDGSVETTGSLPADVRAWLADTARALSRQSRRMDPALETAVVLTLALIGRGGRIATRVELMREVWGHRAAIISRTVDTHVAELRRKLEHDPANPRHILTVRKAGYRFQG